MKTRDGKDHWGKNSACRDRRQGERMQSPEGCGPSARGPLRRMRAVTGCMAVWFALGLPTVSAKPVYSSGHTRSLGQYVASPVDLGATGPNYLPIYPACRALAANFNQFRNLSFASRNPRLSTKYPQFRRPHWTPMAWNRRLAKRIWIGHPGGCSPNDTGCESAWHFWLRQTKALREAGHPLLSRTTVDLLGNGQRETIVRLDHILPYKYVYEHHVPKSTLSYCPYIDVQMYMLSSPNPRLAKVFNSNLLFSWGWHVGWKRGGFMGPTDLIENTHDKKHPYYVLSWQRAGHHGDGVIGVAVLQWSAGDGWSPGYTGLPLCNIKWLAKRAGHAQ